MKPLISVIVPIYKVEKYLAQCINSIVNQTYSNLEIILIDDGSPDQCPKICDEWATKDTRIRVIHKENGGLSDARNAGMKIAQGQYISFVDSDDWIHIQMYERLLQVMEKESADMVSCNFVKTSEFDEKAVKQPCNICLVQSYSAEEAMKALITEQGIQQVVWNKLYKREIIQNILFEFGKYHEDEFWTYQVIGKCQKVVTIDYHGYFYYQRPDSIIGSSYSLKRLDGLKAKAQRQDYIEKYFPSLTSIARLNLFYSSCYAYQCCIRTMDKDDLMIAKKMIKTGVKRYPIKIKDCLYESPKQKIWLILYKISLEWTCILRNRLKVGM